MSRVASRARRALLALLLVPFLAAGVARAEPGDGRPFLLVVVGLGGESYYSDLFARWAANLLAVAHDHLGIADADTVYLAEDVEREAALADGPATRAGMLAAITDLAARSAPGDRVLIVLLGHGTAQGAVARYNLPGPDLDPGTLEGALEALSGRHVAVVNTTPSSAPFLLRLSAPGRVVITATASGSEGQHTRFGGHFVDALASGAADADKDGAVSLLEAFRHANRRVVDAYREEKRLLTEHALLDDNGDRSGSRDADPEDGDGALAARMHFLNRAGGGIAADARLGLELEARRLVDGVERLKRERPTLLADEYTLRLEELLVELALNRRRLRAEAVQ